MRALTCAWIGSKFGSGIASPWPSSNWANSPPIAAVVPVGKIDEPGEVAPARSGRDLHPAQITPSSFPSRPKVSSARPICSSVWVAMRLVRRRHCDGGTAGGTTGFVNTPASNSMRQKRNVFSSGPMSTGTIGVSVGRPIATKGRGVEERDALTAELRVAVVSEIERARQLAR